MSKIQALILQSSSPSIFSAGLDLTELHNPSVDRVTRFWTSVQELYLALYGSRLACIAAIEGHAPAAGCMLALSCDYRIMAASYEKDRPSIGLNESKLGIAAPPWLAQQMIDTVGRRRAEVALQLGLMYSSEDALEIELVDEVVTKNDVRQRAEEAAFEFAQIPPQARVASKMLIRKERIDSLKANQQQDTAHFVGFITHEKVQKNLSAYLEMLASKKKK
jgi:3,2-trans-enoyl-CoA isomerase